MLVIKLYLERKVCATWELRETVPPDSSLFTLYYILAKNLEFILCIMAINRSF